MYLSSVQGHLGPEEAFNSTLTRLQRGANSSPGLDQYSTDISGASKFCVSQERTQTVRKIYSAPDDKRRHKDWRRQPRFVVREQWSATRSNVCTTAHWSCSSCTPGGILRSCSTPKTPIGSEKLLHGARSTSGMHPTCSSAFTVTFLAPVNALSKQGRMFLLASRCPYPDILSGVWSGLVCWRTSFWYWGSHSEDGRCMQIGSVGSKPFIRTIIVV